MDEMVSIKLFKPYYIKMGDDRMRLILAYKYFSVIINHEEYQFVPLKGKEIKVNVRTKEILNTNARYAFKKEKEVKYISLKKLTEIPDFMKRLEKAIQPYHEGLLKEERNRRQQEIARKKIEQEKQDKVIIELERKNLKRLIDKALDEKDKDTFEKLIKLLR